MPPIYAPTSRWWEGQQSAYTAGLSYFSDSAYAPTPLGLVPTDFAVAGGTAVAGPVGGAAAGIVTSVVAHWFGGDAVDQARQERVNYFAQLAAQGNVAAMQLILGGPQNVSGNERSMWETAYTLVKQANPGVVSAAESVGPAWLTNSGDTATNYPKMRAFVQGWAAANPGTSLVNSINNAFNPFAPSPGSVSVGGVPMVAGGGSSSTLLLVAAAVAAVVLLGGRRRA